jgi:hypothetical protein
MSVVIWFKMWLTGKKDKPGWAVQRKAALSRFLELRGKDLACWCPLCEKHKDGRPLNEACEDCPPCHADVLLEIANA